MKQYRVLGWCVLVAMIVFGVINCGGGDSGNPTGPSEADGPLEQFQCASLKQHGRIINGTPTSLQDWPSMVSLGTGAVGTDGHECGGALIHPNWVVTAAHCFDDPGMTTVTLGTASLDSDDAERIGIAAIMVHEGWNSQASNNHDIALVRLMTPSSKSWARIDRDSLAQPGVTGVAAGWGNTSTDDEVYLPELRQVSLPVISNAECAQVHDGITGNMFCAGYANGAQDTCQGDSGGPLMINNSVAGLVSFGAECGVTYGVYTRVANYATWISTTICNAELP